MSECVDYYDASLHRLVLNRSRSGAQFTGQRSVSIDPTQERLELRVFLDRSSIEVFDENGHFSLSSRLYPRPDSLGVPSLSARRMRGDNLQSRTIGVFALDTATTPFAVRAASRLECLYPQPVKQSAH